MGRSPRGVSSTAAGAVGQEIRVGARFDRMAKAVRFWARRAALLLAMAAGLFLPHVAQACDASAVQGAQRQMTAILGQMRTHGCNGMESGVFSRCGGYQQRLTEARRALAQAGCGASLDLATFSREKAASPRQTGRSIGGVPRTTLCVRLSDGYLFPSPNAGFATRLRVADVLAQCRMICETEEMDLFRVDGAERNDDTMISLTTGKPYSDLPNAGAYRTAETAMRCNHAGYSRFIADRQNVSTPDARMTASASVDRPADALAIVSAQSSRWVLRDPNRTIATLSSATRPVRIVGPRFFPQ